MEHLNLFNPKQAKGGGIKTQLVQQLPLFCRTKLQLKKLLLFVILYVQMPNIWHMKQLFIFNITTSKKCVRTHNKQIHQKSPVWDRNIHETKFNRFSNKIRLYSICFIYQNKEMLLTVLCKYLHLEIIDCRYLSFHHIRKKACLFKTKWNFPNVKRNQKSFSQIWHCYLLFW